VPVIDAVPGVCCASVIAGASNKVKLTITRGGNADPRRVACRVGVAGRHVSGGAPQNGLDIAG